MSSSSVVSLLGAADNLHEPEPVANRQSTIFGILIAFLTLSLSCGALRLYVRFRIIRAPGWDDLLLILYMISTAFGSICMCILPSHGLGKHFILLPYSEMVMYLKLFWLCNASYVMATSLIKLSLLFQYIRVYHTGILRRLCIGLAVMVAMWGAACTVVAWYPCRPLQRFWDVRNNPGVCWGYGAATASEFVATIESHAAINMVLDVLIFAIPTSLYFRPENANIKRGPILALFFMGSIVIFTSMWRLATIIEHRAATFPTFDPTWYGPISLLLSVVEVDLASICASAPVFWPMLSTEVEKIFVTHELKITVEDRVADTFELHRSPSGGPSPSGSAVGLERSGTGDSAADKAVRQTHYRNSFIRDQVNPFRKQDRLEGWWGKNGNGNGTGTVQVHVRSERQTPNEGRKKTGLFSK